MSKYLEKKRLSAMFPVAVLFLGPILSAPATAAPDANITITVDTTTDSNAAGYRVCSDAGNDCSLRGAISLANSDTSNTYTIALAENTYALTLTGTGEDSNATGDLDILTNLTISGVYSNTTVIDANQIDRVLDVIGSVNVWIKNVKIINGRAPDGAAGTIGFPNGTPGSSGGGIRNAGLMKLENSIVANNRAGDGGAGNNSPAPGPPGGNGGQGGAGGGIFTANTLTLLETVVRNNRSGDGGAGGAGGFMPGGIGFPGGNGGNSGSGGGVDNSGSLSVIKSIISLNVTGNGGSGGAGGPENGGGFAPGFGGFGGDGGVGGGIFTMSPMTMNDSAIDSNLTGNGGTGGAGGSSGGWSPAVIGGQGGRGGLGGGIFNKATATLDNNTISSNATGNGGVGGVGGNGTPGTPAGPGGGGGNGGLGAGVYNIGTLNLTNLHISGNTTGSGGIGGAGGNDIVALPPSNQGGNGGNGGDGGGLFDNNSTTSNNVTIANDSTGSGGAGGAGGLPVGTPGAAGVGGNGGGILISAAGTVTVMNTILAKNTATFGPDCNGNLTSQDYNLVENTNGCTIAGSVGNDIYGQDPRLAPLANNGGYTRTHALKPGSPAIDTANPAAVGSGANACSTQDQRGVSRPINGDWSGAAICDIGAYERQIFLYLSIVKR